MQIQLQMEGNDIRLPMAYNHLIQGLLFRELEKIDSSYSTRLHNQKHKPFTFGSLRGDHTTDREKKEISFKESIRLEIRSADPLFIQILLSSFRKGKTIEIENNNLKVWDVKLINKSFHCENGLIRMVTPITVKKATTGTKPIYWTPLEEGFYRAVENSVYSKWGTALGNDNLDFFIGPASKDTKYRKEVRHFVKEEDGKKRVTSIDGYMGSFYLTGSPVCLDFLYNVGLGGRNAQGFGMFERDNRYGRN